MQDQTDGRETGQKQRKIRAIMDFYKIRLEVSRRRQTGNAVFQTLGERPARNLKGNEMPARQRAISYCFSSDPVFGSGQSADKQSNRTSMPFCVSLTRWQNRQYTQ